MTIQARYSGTCPECGGRWQPGDLIRAREDEKWMPDQSVLKVAVWQHAHCPDDPADPSLKPGETVCTACWLVHPVGACDR